MCVSGPTVTCSVDPPIDNSGQQGGGRQPGPGRHHLSHRWGQHRGDDAPGGPKQDQVCLQQTGTHHAEVNNQHMYINTPVAIEIK